jgi:hypothetical protein
MKKLKLMNFALVATCLLAVPLALGRGENIPASTKESAATSGEGNRAGEQKAIED